MVESGVNKEGIICGRPKFYGATRRLNLCPEYSDPIGSETDYLIDAVRGQRSVLIEISRARL